ncbi:MAG: biotin--[acetyl-CoA-carboxylase] ligase [Gemmatimonadales bacterium]|jgi:BirA family biotin operon repressor/biotin-[acetyl-CoA-carboxylase] ligase
MSARRISKWAGRTEAELRRRWERPDVHLFGKVGSTNDEAKRLAEKDAPAGTIVIGREQTGGRGRGGRVWHSPPNSGVYLSMVFRPIEVGNPGLLPVAAGLGVVRALDLAFSTLGPALKWPNDIYAGERKCGGILAEASWSKRAPRQVIVGVGINAKPLPSSVPAAVRSSATSIEDEIGAQVDLADVADAIVHGLEAFLREPASVLDHGALELLDHYDWLRDRRVSVLVDRADSATTGVAVGIAPDGALLFRPDRGALRRIENAVVVPETPLPRKASG